MKHFVGTLFMFIFLGPVLLAQHTGGVVAYDLIYMKDSRGILKGEILVYDEQDGHIVFIDTEGRKYTIARWEYDYFIEDKVFVVNQSDTLIINERKSEGAEISLGLVAGYIMVNQTVIEDANYLDGSTGLVYLPLSFKLSIGKYINRQNFVGFTADIALLGEAKTYFNGGLRYVYQYPGYKSNIAFYLPLELQYGNLTGMINYTTTDTTFDNGSYSWPTYRDIETSIHTVGLHVGQGLAFILPDKRSIKVELTFVKNFIINEKHLNLVVDGPISSFSQSGIRLGILYSL